MKWSSLVWLVLLVAGVLGGGLDLAWSGKMALLIFSVSIWAWTFSGWDATWVALAAAFAVWASGLTAGTRVLSGLGDPFIAFVIAGFMLGGAYKTTGLSDRIAGWFLQRSRRIDQLFYLITTALLLLSFVIPSTSARAALLMPIYVSVAGMTAQPAIRKALALLFPTIIVLSCVTSYLGAGANLMTADFVFQYTQQSISYTDWLIMGAPLGIISCYASTWVILRFMSPSERSMTFILKDELPSVSSNQQKAGRWVVGVTLSLVVIWMTEPYHGIDAGMATLAGALVLCMPVLGVYTFKQALSAVEWSLVVFMAATLEMSHALVQNGVVDYAMRYFAAISGFYSSALIVSGIVVISLLSHLFIHSRTARAAVLMPILIPIGISVGESGVLIAFFSNAAMGYCLTLPVCAKPVAMFSTAGGEGYTTADLLKLSAWLLPFHLVLFCSLYWVYQLWL